MGIPAGVSRVAFSGTAPSGEIFQWGFWTTQAATTAAQATSFANAVRTVWNDTTVRLPITKLIKNDTNYTKIKVYSYPTGGPVASFIGENTIGASSGGQGTGTGNAPLYQCMVVSTHTGLSGRSHNGRFYLPANGTALSETHTFESTDVTAVAGACKNLMDGVFGIETPFIPQPLVVSQFLSSSDPIVSLSVDSKPDVQRRRENRMASGFTVTVTLD